MRKAERRLARRMEKYGGKGFRILRSAEATPKRYLRPAQRPTDTLRQAAALMREEHGPDHKRHEMWSAMADLLGMQADHALGGGAVCGSCVDQALAVADAYLEADR